MAADLSARGSAVVPFGIEGTPGGPVLRWDGRATSVAGIDRELGRIWASPRATAAVPADGERTIAARTSVLNLVVVAGSPELGEQAAATLAAGTGRHPSRTLILAPTDPDGPGWLRASVRAWCMVPRTGAAETCAEQVYVAAGGETGRHLEAIVAPLLVHDLPVTVWWPGDPPLGDEAAITLVRTADRLVVDGSRFRGDGLARLVALAGLAGPSLPVSDFALMRQARWREALASIFDLPEHQPYLRSIRRVTVSYASHGGSGVEAATNLVKPIYHVAWLASRLGLDVVRPLERMGRPRRAGAGPGAPALVGRDLGALLAWPGGAPVNVAIRPTPSAMPGGTTLGVELRAERLGTSLRVEVTADAAGSHVLVRVREGRGRPLERVFHAARRTDADLLTEAIEAGGRDSVAEGTLAMAARLAEPQPAPVGA